MSADEPVYEGGCHCGRVRYRVIGPFQELSHCHCTDCQKSHGAAFATYAGVPKNHFTFLKGEDQLRTYQAKSGTRRYFCRTCGSNVTGESDRWDEIYVAVGTLDTPPQWKQVIHYFVRSKVSWYNIRDDFPRHAAYPED